MPYALMPPMDAGKERVPGRGAVINNYG